MAETSARADAPASAPAGTGHFPAFDGLRAIAATIVLVTHCSFSAGANGLSWLGVFYARMDAGVAIFFVISGFLLYRPYLRARLGERPRPSARAFLWRRALRIYPAYWLAMTVIVLVFEVNQKGFINAEGQWHIGNMLLFYSLMHVYSINTVFGPLVQSWTLATEVAFYLFLPIYALVMSRPRGTTPRDRLRAEAIGLVVLFVIAFLFKWWVLYGRFDDGHTGMMMTWLPAWLDLFAMGMLLGLVSVWTRELGHRVPLRLDGRWAPAISWGLALLAFWVVSTQIGLPVSAIKYTPWQQMWKHYLYGLFGFFLLIPAVFGPERKGVIRRFLLNPVVQYVGLVSYGIYLWHEFFIDRYLHWTGLVFFGVYNSDKPFALHWHVGTSNVLSGAFATYVLAVFAMTLATATVSWYALEKPVLRLRNLVGRPPRPRP